MDSHPQRRLGRPLRRSRPFPLVKNGRCTNNSLNFSSRNHGAPVFGDCLHLAGVNLPVSPRLLFLEKGCEFAWRESNRFLHTEGENELETECWNSISDTQPFSAGAASF